MIILSYTMYTLPTPILLVAPPITHPVHVSGPHLRVAIVTPLSWLTAVVIRARGVEGEPTTVRLYYTDT